ncbi:MAG TPA: helix-turn-helix transcriptional regulator [Acetobacteraceae bacterium]|jgi:AraC-like DNA-binding protein|nr:helix-turn-helix transcriptional regulator [Acetobacteraceae bacterium]
MSQNSQTVRARLRPFEQAPRPLVGYAIDYHEGNDTGWHLHPRAQLLHALAGVLRVQTETAQFIVPPGTGLWMPARTLHVTRMPAGLRMRALFLRADAARAGPGTATVVAVSPLLRELILAACEEPVAWDERGHARHIAALALHEIRRAATQTMHLPSCRDPRLQRVTAALLADPADQRGLGAHAEAAGASERTLARLFRRETGMSFVQWRRQLRLTEGLARLAQGETPPRAAAAVGYASGPAFGAAYRAAFGTTPGRTRRGRS